MPANHDFLVTLLSTALADPLPGPTAQAIMSPRPRLGWVPGVVPDDVRQAAGLVLLYPVDARSHLLLTVRRADLPDHAGQVSFPGGEIEDGETRTEAALREAREEVGLEPGSVAVIGRLTALHIPVSRFVLHPVVAIASQRPNLAPSDDEVDRLLEAPVEHLIGGDHLAVRNSNHRGAPARVPYFDIDGVELWGATAMVVSELLAVLGAPPDPWHARNPALDG